MATDPLSAPDFAISALLQALLFGESELTHPEHKKLVLGGVCERILEDIGITKLAIENNAQLQDIEHNDPRIKSAYPEAVEANLDIKTLCSCCDSLSSLVENFMAGESWKWQWDVFPRYYMLRQNYNNQGRNLFVSAKRYRGVGPYEDQAEAPAVQPGDHIVLIPTVEFL
jgi:hypothetical protein